MKLYLVRHGEYLTHDVESGESLSAKGREDVQRLADYLRSMHINVANIFHSGKKRAEQTAEMLASGVGCQRSIAARHGLAPNDNVKSLAQELAAWEEDTLLVGHLPFMSRMVSQLVIGNEDKEIVAFAAGTLVCLQKIDSEKWLITWMWTPSP